jgi:hypothetical protein
MTEQQKENTLGLPEDMTIEEYAMASAIASIKQQREIAEIVARDKSIYEQMDAKEKMAFVQNLSLLHKSTGDMISKIIKHAADTKNIYLKQEAMKLLQSGAFNKKRLEIPVRACHYENTERE